ncbi:unnamed protein product [Rotaria magnacalcarata]|uniref:MACPF domain-containing protein n=1 Tax=Rotaria magnacalcarata TaxID=392030 RepID=A0A816YFM2_9BILA|nr:unnamed protein product [Rotaria magnacalcarata]
MFDVFNEVTLGSTHSVAIAYDRSSVQIFRNASQLNEAWRRSFAEGMFYFKRDDAPALSQRLIELYTLTSNISTIEFNSFPRDATSKLTPNFDPDLYEDFLDAWGTHIITKSIVGGIPLRTNSIYIFPNSLWQQNGITVAGGNGQGNGINQFSNPYGLYVDDDQTVYVADQSDHRIMEWKSGATNGRVVAGGNGQGNETHQLFTPLDVIVDKDREIISLSAIIQIQEWFDGLVEMG